MTKCKILLIITNIIISVDLLSQMDPNFCGTDTPSQQWQNEFQRLVSEFTVQYGSDELDFICTAVIGINQSGNELIHDEYIFIN